MYVFGFREGWLRIFPHHPALVVDLAAFAVVFGIAYFGAGLAFRIQYHVILVLAASPVAVLGNVHVWRSGTPLVLWGSFRGAPETHFARADFWVVFAVFFAAATGIMAGANMSGEPRRGDVDRVRRHIEGLRDLCRIPGTATTLGLVGSLEEAIVSAPQSDMDILGMRREIDLELVARVVTLTRSSCMVTMDGGEANALA
jgi:hypothetical protein